MKEINPDTASVYWAMIAYARGEPHVTVDGHRWREVRLDDIREARTFSKQKISAHLSRLARLGLYHRGGTVPMSGGKIWGYVRITTQSESRFWK